MTSPVDTSVKFLHSGMVGAPVLSGSVGALLAVLDACLLNGWGIKTVSNLTVTGNVATMTTTASFAAEVGSVVLVSGATPAALNGEQKVTAVTATTVSFATSGITNQTATGTITFKQASLGWVSDFSGTNVKAYRSNETTATKSQFRVDDTTTTRAKVIGYVTMSDVNTGTDQFPRDIDTESGVGLYWWKSNTADTNARNWMLVGDGRFFYLAVAIESGVYANSYLVLGFGDPLMLKSADPFGAVLCGVTGTIVTPGAGYTIGYPHQLLYSNPTIPGHQWCPRSHVGLGYPVSSIKGANVFGYVPTQQATSGHLSYYTIYPNPTDGGLYLSQVTVSTNSATLWTPRYTFPGLYHVPMHVPDGYFLPRDTVTGVTSLPGKTLKCVTTQGSASITDCKPAFFEITGPWR